MAKKKSKKSSFTFNIKHFMYLFIIITLILTVVFVTKERPAEAAASFYVNQVTPAGEVRRGGPLVFDVMVLGQSAGSAVNTGVEFDNRKLRLDSIEAGVLGEITWEPIADEGDKGRVVIHNSNVTSAQEHTQFARVHFTIIDQTDEVDEQGRGFIELCTTFDPDIDTPTSTPPQGNPPTTNPSQPTPTSIVGQPTNTPVPQTNQPTPTPILSNNLDKSKLCIPLHINGSTADKMDFILIPMNYPNYDTFVDQAQLAIQRMGETNLSQYQQEVLSKMNWYLLNTHHNSIPVQFRGRAINENEQESFMSAVQGLCPHDRYVYFVNEETMLAPGGYAIGGSALLYEGFIVAARNLYDPRSNVFQHEWGHAAAGLIDEYDAGRWYQSNDPKTAYNCTRTPNQHNPRPDPCPYGHCNDSVNDQKYKTVCPQWDCTQMQCDALQRELFKDAGCYQRCSSQQGYRPAPLSIMDAAVGVNTDDLLKFNGPSLYSIIQYTFTKYR